MSTKVDWSGWVQLSVNICQHTCRIFCTWTKVKSKKKLCAERVIWLNSD